MANSFFVPFNHQPDSVTTHTAPVTLGSDEYARLIVLPHTTFSNQSVLSNASDIGITIDGTLVVPQTLWFSTDFDSNESFTIDATGELFIITEAPTEVYIDYEGSTASRTLALSSTGIARRHASQNNIAISAQDPASLSVYAGCRIFYNGSSNNNRDFTAWLKPYEEFPKEFWLPPSTVISSGDGAVTRPFMLERYNLYS